MTNKIINKQFYREMIRVFKVTKKPTKEEFVSIIKVTSLGILLIGIIGFVVSLVKLLW